MCLHIKRFMYSHCWHMSPTPTEGNGYILPIKCAAIIEALERYHGIGDSTTLSGNIPDGWSLPASYTAPPPFATGGSMDIQFFQPPIGGMLAPTPVRPPPTPPFVVTSTPSGAPLIARAPGEPLYGRMPPPNALFRWVVTRSFQEGIQDGTRTYSVPPRPRTPTLCPPVWGTLTHRGNVLVQLINWWCPDCVRARQPQAEAEARGGQWVRVQTPEFVVVMAPGEEERELAHLSEKAPAMSTDGGDSAGSLPYVEREKDRSAAAQPLTAGEGGPLILGDRDCEEPDVAQEAGRRTWNMLRMDNRLIY